MGNNQELVNKLHELSSKINNGLYSPASDLHISPSFSEIPVIEIPEEATIPYQLDKQTNQIIEKCNEQIKLLQEQNQSVERNYKKLEDLYNLKDQELSEAKADAKKAKHYNIAMMIITIISMLVAVAAWVFPR